jgi:hypothetical protein
MGRAGKRMMNELVPALGVRRSQEILLFYSMGSGSSKVARRQHDGHSLPLLASQQGLASIGRTTPNRDLKMQTIHSLQVATHGLPTQASIRASLVESEKTRTEKVKFSAPKT